MTKKVTSAEAKAHLAEIVSHVAQGRERYLIERRGKAVAAIVSVEDLTALEGEPRLRERPAGALALVGAWGELPDAEIDALIDTIYRERERDKGRPVTLGQ